MGFGGAVCGDSFVYELFDLWNSPWWTAWLIVGYFVAALVIDGVFKHATFCKFVCPIGQFNFVASTVSPLEVKVRDLDVCTRCGTKDCIRGRRDVGGARGRGRTLWCCSAAASWRFFSR